MLKKPISCIILSSLLLIGCSNNETANDKSEEQGVEVEKISNDKKQDETIEIKESKEKKSFKKETLTDKLEEEGYIVNGMIKYGDFKLGDEKDSFMDFLNSNNHQYTYLCTTSECEYIIYSNHVFEFGEPGIMQIISIEDQNGNAVDPNNLDFAKEEAQRLSNIKIQEAEEEERDRQEMLEEFKRRQVEQSTIRVGMTQDEVLKRWGKPEDINRTITAAGTDEQWVYPNYTYVYFEDGVLITIQD